MDNNICINESFLIEALERIQEAIYITDNNGIVVYINNAAEKLEQIERNKLIGKHISEIYNYVQFQDDKNSPCLQVLETNLPQINENLEWFTPEGNLVNAISNTYPIRRQDKVVGVIEIAEKIADIKNKLANYCTYENKLSYPLKKKQMNNGTIYVFDDIICKNKTMKAAVITARRFAMQKLPVLIYGETGTGKEMFAQSIHNASPFVKGPFVPINCAALPATLLESILFGTVKGAFTGAVDNAGLLEQAEKGTIFLDEMNSMDMFLQAKLLRALQEKEIQRIGDAKRRPINCRIISAINQGPTEAIAANNLREDLFYRLSTGIIHIPPLRDRGYDLEVLIYNFIKKYNNELNIKVSNVDNNLLALLNSYRWPGNIRELSNVIESSMNMVGEMEETLTMNHLSTYFIRRLNNENELTPLENFSLERKNFQISTSSIEKESNGTLYDMLHHYEKNLIEQALIAAEGNRTHCSDRLGISRQNLSHKLRKYRINVTLFKKDNI